MNTLNHLEIQCSPFTKLVIVKKCPFHNHTFFEFVINFDGEYENQINGVTHSVEKGHILLLRPEDRHRFVCKGNHTHRDVYVSCEKMKAIADCIDKNLYDELANKPLAVFFKVSDYQLQMLESKLNFFNTSENHSKLSLNLAHTNVITELLTLWQQSFNDKQLDYPEWLSTLLHRLKTENYLLKSINEIVATTNYSHAYVCKQFKKYTGITLNQYVSNEKFAYALAMLQNKDTKSADVANKLNYASTPNFISAFKKKYGVPPTEWQNQHLVLSRQQKEKDET